MKTLAAVVEENGTEFELRTLDVAEPGFGEVHLKFVASGLCHTDLHLVDGVLVGRKPIVAGHEGAGIIESVGPGVTRVKPGDHVVCSFVPSCGTCRYCATGRSSLCDWAANSLNGTFPDGRFRFHADGRLRQPCMIGTFPQRATVSEHSVVKVDDWFPLEVAVLRLRCADRVGTATTAGGASRRHRDRLRDRWHWHQRRTGCGLRAKQCSGPSRVQAGDGAEARRHPRLRPLRRPRRRSTSSPGGRWIKRW